MTPSRNRKSAAGNPPPTVRAPVLDPTLRGDDGNVGIIRSPVRAIVLPDPPASPCSSEFSANPPKIVARNSLQQFSAKIRKTAEVCRRHGIAEATLYKWKAKYGGLEVSDAKRFKALEDENRRLKKLLAASLLDNAALKDILGKTVEACGPGFVLSRSVAWSE